MHNKYLSKVAHGIESILFARDYIFYCMKLVDKHKANFEEKREIIFKIQVEALEESKMLNHETNTKVQNLSNEAHEQMKTILLKVNNLAHSISDGDKCINTFLKELNKLFNSLKVLHKNSIHVLYDDVVSPLPIDIVKYLLVDATYVKFFEDWSV